MSHTLKADHLQATVARILEAAGSSPAEARQVAANLVLANLSGHDSHGVGMLPRYVDAVAEGGLKPNAAVRVNLDIGTLMGLDGQHGYGQIVGVQAMELGIARAKQHGSCIFTLAHAHHLGRIGHFADGDGAGAGVDALRQRALAAGGRALGRRRRALRHQPVLHRHSARRRGALRARLRDQPRGAGQDARGAQQGRACARRLPDRRKARPPTTPAWWWCRRATASSARS